MPTRCYRVYFYASIYSVPIAITVVLVAAHYDFRLYLLVAILDLFTALEYFYALRLAAVYLFISQLSSGLLFHDLDPSFCLGCKHVVF